LVARTAHNACPPPDGEKQTRMNNVQRICVSPGWVGKKNPNAPRTNVIGAFCVPRGCKQKTMVDQTWVKANVGRGAIFSTTLFDQKQKQTWEKKKVDTGWNWKKAGPAFSFPLDRTGNPRFPHFWTICFFLVFCLFFVRVYGMFKVLKATRGEREIRSKLILAPEKLPETWRLFTGARKNRGTPWQLEGNQWPKFKMWVFY